jgi:hypothetical protein
MQSFAVAHFENIYGMKWSMDHVLTWGYMSKKFRMGKQTLYSFYDLGLTYFTPEK